MNKPSHKGSCLCSQVTYAVHGDFEHFFLCHCTHCQKGTGTAHGANLFSRTARLEWLSGKEQVQIFRLPGTGHVKSFCKACGSPLPVLQKELGLLMVPAGSLDDPVAIRPNAHLFMASKAHWEQDLEAVPKISGLPE